MFVSSAPAGLLHASLVLLAAGGGRDSGCLPCGRFSRAARALLRGLRPAGIAGALPGFAGRPGRPRGALHRVLPVRAAPSAGGSAPRGGARLPSARGSASLSLPRSSLRPRGRPTRGPLFERRCLRKVEVEVEAAAGPAEELPVDARPGEEQARCQAPRWQAPSSPPEDWELSWRRCRQPRRRPLWALAFRRFRQPGLPSGWGRQALQGSRGCCLRRPPQVERRLRLGSTAQSLPASSRLRSWPRAS